MEEKNRDRLESRFPIFLVEHNKYWIRWYKEERKSILSIIPNELIKRISHIGSTAILEIFAKNIIDILLEIRSEADLDIVKNVLLACGWKFMNRTEQRIILNKGYTEQGFSKKVFHLHIRINGDNDELFSEII